MKSWTDSPLITSFCLHFEPQPPSPPPPPPFTHPSPEDINELSSDGFPLGLRVGQPLEPPQHALCSRSKDRWWLSEHSKHAYGQGRGSNKAAGTSPVPLPWDYCLLLGGSKEALPAGKEALPTSKETLPACSDTLPGGREALPSPLTRVVHLCDRQVEVLIESVHHALRLPEPQQAVVHKHAVQSVAQHLQQEGLRLGLDGWVGLYGVVWCR
jgi:hypothetical protein